MIVENHKHFTEGPLTLEEVIKIISLLENPPEAHYIRKALRIYDLPQRFFDPENYEWGTNATLMRVLLHYFNPQSEYELGKMLEHVAGCTKLLEIGSSFGGTLKRMAAVMPKGSTIVSVDLDCDDTPKFLNPMASLKETCRQLSMLGATVHLQIGDSKNKAIIQNVKDYGPYDFAFIDGDHSYEGVKSDWENYGPMAKTVAFHDTASTVLGVAQLWKEIKESGRYRCEEYVAPERQFGIGVVFRSES